MKDYRKLQNGSDLRGIALPGVPGEEVNLTPAIAKDFGTAFALWIAQRTGKAVADITVAVGRDSRLSGPDIQQGTIEGLTAAGVKVLHCGMASTPAMFMSTVLQGFQCDGSVMITASHLPFNRNGLKFFVPEGGLEKAHIAQLIEIAQGELPTDGKGEVTQADLISAYADNMRRIICEGIGDEENYDQPLKGFKIAVDAGNGAGGFFAHKVLEPLGADVSASRYLDPDGSFPNHIPNPEDKDAMKSIIAAVTENGCDLGLIFDTDVDRAGAVDAKGEELNRNRLIALMAAIVLENDPGATIVTDSVTSTQLKAFIEGKLGGVHHRFKRGYKNVINESIRLNNQGTSSPLAMETSGHGALRENYFLDDGAYLSAKMVIQAARLRKQGRTLADMLEGMGEPAEAAELRFKIAGENFGDYGRAVVADLLTYAEEQGWQIAPDNYEGVRVAFGEEGMVGWLLLRLSLHDPIMPLNMESDDIGGVKKIAAKLLPFLQKYDRLDISALTKLLA